MTTHIIPEYRMCSKCILDTNDDPNIQFNSKGVCNYCSEYDELLKNKIIDSEEKQKLLTKTVELIKKAGKKKEYDCIVGISGGADSTYLACEIKKLGLRPLMVHFDNGWNSERAVKNIEKVLNNLGLDLFTYVVDWEEFKDIQLSFIKASVIDIELVTDHAIVAILYREAVKRGIKYIITGHNFVTEAILPKSWYHAKMDVMNIKAIHKKYGKVKMKTYPIFDYFSKAYSNNFLKLKVVNLLDYLDYNKENAKKIITDQFGWKDYGGKHYESIFTRFFQGYILPVKFKVDKRKAHLSTLINSGQITRAEALKEFSLPVYDPIQLKEDKEFVLKKFELSEVEFSQLMEMPVRSHMEHNSYLKYHYKYEVWLSQKMKPITRPLKKIIKNFFKK
jgi:N-acetyl sugar amidotransferase